MKYCLSAIFICLFALLSSAQSSFVPAYIVNDKGDTLRGEAKVNPKKELEKYEKVTFKDASGIQKIYKPEKIKAYGYKDHDFIVMDSEGEKFFFDRIQNGDLLFLKLGYEAMRMNAVVVEEEYYLFNSESKEPVPVKHNNFKKQLNDWMKDNLEIIEEYGEEKKFDLEKATTVIAHYNAWKSGK